MDVCVLDIKMPPTFTDEGLRAAAEIRARWPRVGVLVLSQYAELGLAIRLLADGAEGLGYLLKDWVADVEEFVDAVRRVGEGGSALDPTVVSQMLSRRQADEDLGRLTPREHIVLEAMAQGPPTVPSRTGCTSACAWWRSTSRTSSTSWASSSAWTGTAACLRCCASCAGSSAVVVRPAAPPLALHTPTAGRVHAPCPAEAVATRLSG